MMKMFFYIGVLLTLPFVTISGFDNGKVPLSHDLYDGWKNIFRPQISNDGNWVSWEVNPQRGDGTLYIKNVNNGFIDSMPRGHSARFSPNSDYIAFFVSPPQDYIRQARLEGRGDNQLPGDSVAIYLFSRRSNSSAARAGSFALAERESGWMVYLLRQPPSLSVRSDESITVGASRDNDQGSAMFVFNPVTGETHQFSNVVHYSFSANGRSVAFIQNESIVHSHPDILGVRHENEPDVYQVAVNVFNTDTRENTLIHSGIGSAMSIKTCDKGQQVIFLFSSGSSGVRNPVYDLWYWSYQDEGRRALPLVTTRTPGLPSGWSVNKNSAVNFSSCGDRIFLGTSERVIESDESSTANDERYSVDIWHFLDPLIQPQQIVNLTEDQNRSYTAIYHLDKSKLVQLASPDLPEVTIMQKGDGRFELGASSESYQIQNSFESGAFADIYLVDTDTGERNLVLEKYRGSPHLSTLGDARLSPEGKYLLYYSQADSNWYSRPTDGRPERIITAEIPYPLYNELHDQPSSPGPYGMAVWKEDDSYVLIFDRFDIWMVDPEGLEAPVNLTNGYGRLNGIRFRYPAVENDRRVAGRRDRLIISALNIRNKQSGFYTIQMNRRRDPVELIMSDAHYSSPIKAEDANILIWQRGSFIDFPDLYVSNTNFRNIEKITGVNSRQSDYYWGEAELVEWISYNNDTLQGILYKPENLDPEKKYPMIVYFYERLSHQLHRHYVPAPSRSTINIPYFVSNGYIVFVPDIKYTPGYPGLSAYNSVVSGTKSMADRHTYIDRDRIGIQGQSWAGYQIAWLITQTDIFSAAMAGAPVTNMTSAYGGIRWSTGLSRIYQYEETQSRIGGTLWEVPQKYIDNSPLFFADKVNTPLLIMHNDNDGAVPWSQGIEFYMALRRLGKPVWMLNYNDEAHNLQKRPNMIDLSIRMSHFFDHYLKDEPAPEWLERGIPALKKGTTDGYDFIE